VGETYWRLKHLTEDANFIANYKAKRLNVNPSANGNGAYASIADDLSEEVLGEFDLKATNPISDWAAPPPELHPFPAETVLDSIRDASNLPPLC